MAFGTLTIRMESGEIRKHVLDSPITSVGRQPGNDIVLATTSVSRYHAQFDVTEGQVFLVDLGAVNGTFLNDQQIEPNSRVPLKAGDEIIMGDVSLVFYPPEEHPERVRPSIGLEPEVGTVRQEGVPFQLMLDIPQPAVAPGARLQLVLIIENLGDQPELYTVELGGLNREWVKTNRRDVRLDPHEQTEVIISVRPPRSSQTKPGLYPLTVTVKLKEQPDVKLEAVREINVVGYAGLAVIVRERKQPGSYHVAVQNQGNTPVSLQLGGFHPRKLLRYRFEPNQMSLAPGETEQVKLRVQPRGIRLMGTPETTEFVVVARSLDAAGYQAPVMAYYTITPSWTTLLTPLIGLGALVVLVIGAVLAFILLRPGMGSQAEVAGPSAETALPPTPTQFVPPETNSSPGLPAVLVEALTADPPGILFRTQGKDVALRWQLPNDLEDQIAIQVFQLGPDGMLGAPITNAELGLREAVIARESLYPGENRFLIQATGPNGLSQSEQVAVTVQIPVCKLAGKGVQFFYLPNEAALYADPPSASDSQQVVVLGRDETAEWLQVILATVYTPQAGFYWVHTEDIVCEGNIDSQDFVLTVETQEGNPPAIQETPVQNAPEDEDG